MKRYYWIIFLGVLVATGCGKDDISTINGSEGGDVVDTTITIDTADCDRVVRVVFSTAGNASVVGTGDSVTASVSGNYITVTNASRQKVLYQVSGTTDDGYLKIYSGRKQVILLNGASITNPRGAAINVQGPAASPSKGKRVDLVLTGTNRLADGSSYTLTPEGEDEKGVIFSEGQIVVGGTGSLEVVASGKAGITSDDWVQFTAGSTISVSSSAGHGVRGKDYVLVSGGTLNISVSADGKKGISSDSLVRFDGGVTTIAITGNTTVTTTDGVRDTSGTAGVKADRLFEMNGGSLTITNSGTGGKGISCDGAGYFRGGTVDITVTGNNYGSSSSGGGPGGPGGGPGGGNRNDNSVGAKGIKCDGNIEISGGVITVKASKHEGIETKGTLVISGGQVYSQSSDDAINSASDMTITGGTIVAYSTGNDGLDANGNCYLQGGVIYAIGTRSPEVAIDANTEGGKKLYVQGGTIVAIGSLESGAQLSQACYQSSSWSQNKWYSITVGSDTYAFKTPASGGNKLMVSGSERPTVKKEVTVEGGTEMCNGMLVASPIVSGGTNVSLSNYSSNGW